MEGRVRGGVVLILILARKPISEKTVAKNVKEHGTGGLNIDASRISGPAWTWGTQTDIKGGGYGSKRPGDGDVFAKNVESNPMGRWPANLILEHRPGCEKTAEVEVGKGAPVFNKKDTITETREGYMRPNRSRYSHNLEGGRRSIGKEVVEQWECVEDCPVLALSEQSGVTRSVASKKFHSAYQGDGATKFLRGNSHAGNQRDDEGTAARFFKQVQRKK
jgi:hypothetical protein